MVMLIKNIKELVGVETSPRLKASGKEMSELKTIKNAWLLIEDGRIKDFGSLPPLLEERGSGGEVIKQPDYANIRRKLQGI
jgi:imidazolonepropionase